MKLRAYQEAVRDLCFAHHPEDVLPAFGLYRDMVRSRFVGMAEVAFRQTRALVEEPAFRESLARFFASEPPRRAILREVIADFGAFAQRDEALLADAPLQTRDMLLFEGAKWRVASDDARVPEAFRVREPDFDGVVVTNPNLVALSLQYDVSERADDVADPHVLLVYRRAEEEDVHWYRAPEVLHTLFARPAETTLADVARELFASGGEEKLVELAGALTVAVERGVILGVRDAS